jgi:hypothetical protein
MLVASGIARVGAADSALATAATARAAGGQDAALHWLEAAVHLQLGDQRRAAALLDVFARVAPEEATTVLRSRPFTDLATAEALVP